MKRIKKQIQAVLAWVDEAIEHGVQDMEILEFISYWLEVFASRGTWRDRQACEILEEDVKVLWPTT